MLIRRAAFNAVGGWDERYFLYIEDTDFCRRCAQAGRGRSDREAKRGPAALAPAAAPAARFRLPASARPRRHVVDPPRACGDQSRLRQRRDHLGDARRPPLFVLLCKALGLYDRDEHLIHKTTLDEIPALFGIATLTALLLVFSDGLFFTSGLSRGEAAVLWLLLFVLLICMRSMARWTMTRVLPARALPAGRRPSARGRVPRKARPHDTTARASWWATCLPQPARSREPTAGWPRSPTSSRCWSSKSIDRVVIAPPADGGGDELLYIIRELKSTGSR